MIREASKNFPEESREKVEVLSVELFGRKATTKEEEKNVWFPEGNPHGSGSPLAFAARGRPLLPPSFRLILLTLPSLRLSSHPLLSGPVPCCADILQAASSMVAASSDTHMEDLQTTTTASSEKNITTGTGSDSRSGQIVDENFNIHHLKNTSPLLTSKAAGSFVTSSSLVTSRANCGSKLQGSVFLLAKPQFTSCGLRETIGYTETATDRHPRFSP